MNSNQPVIIIEKSYNKYQVPQVDNRIRGGFAMLQAIERKLGQIDEAQHVNELTGKTRMVGFDWTIMGWGQVGKHDPKNQPLAQGPGWVVANV